MLNKALPDPEKLIKNELKTLDILRNQKFIFLGVSIIKN